MITDYIHNKLFEGIYQPYCMVFEISRAQAESLLPRRLERINKPLPLGPFFVTYGFGFQCADSDLVTPAIR